MEFDESTLSVDFRNHRATIGYRAEKSGVAVHITGLQLTTSTSELEAAVQDRVRRDAREILARLLAELETPGG
jgi:hypothetical protein